MNKADLNAKWGNYCNTNKLVDDMMAVLRKSNHRYSEHGVCTILDEYFKRKESLIKMFITSNHYIGGMRIAIKKDFDRDLDRNAIWNFCYHFSESIGASKILLRYEDEDGKSITDYLKTGCKKKNLVEMEMPDTKEVVKKLKRFELYSGATQTSYDLCQDFDYYMSFFRENPATTIAIDSNERGVELKKGMKMSRAFNKVCTHYGIDKATGYNKLFAQYADLVTASTRSLYFVISLNPLDYLTMSNGNSWTSCHRITGSNGYGAMCASGCMSYLLDDVSIITYVVDNILEPIHDIGKIYRQMYYFENDLFIQSRLYPQGNDGATNLYDKFRGLMQEEFSELLSLESEEWTHQIGPSHVVDYSVDKGAHYPDARSNRQCGIFYPTEKKDKIRLMPKMTIGHKSLCCYCGRPHDNRNRLSHADCTI